MKLSTTPLCRTIFVAILCAIITSSGSAQTPGPNPRGGMGVPAGSYTTDSLESINYFNGRLHFELPLLNIRGRGEAQHGVMLTIDQVYPGAGKGCPNCPNFFRLSPAVYEYEVGYGPGVLEAVVEGKEQTEIECPQGGAFFNNPTRTYLRFKGGDGTEYSLYDVLNDGQTRDIPQQCPTSARAALRGRVFVTKDGSAVTFISDVDIYDNSFGSGPEHRYFPSGVLKLRDGTRYRIDNGVVTTLTDRNGNQNTYEYYPPAAPNFPLPASLFPAKVKKIIDSLGREVQVTYDNPTGVATERYDEISYTGFANQPRTIRVYYARLEHVLRPNESIQSYCQLSLDCESLHNGQPANPLVVSSVVLADGRSLHFYYNRYAELTRYELPTGGAVEFDYDWGLHLAVFTSDVYRRVVQRRTYPDGGTGSSYESKTTYSRPEFTVLTNGINEPRTVGYVEVDSLGRPSGFDVLLSRERHYYNGMAGAPRWSVNSAANFGPSIHAETSLRYMSWQQGREIKTEYLAADGTSVLRREEFEWRQTATPSWWTVSPDLAPENNPRLVETITTLVDAGLVSKQSSINPNNPNIVGFDQFNNQTDLWEYDYGVLGHGPLLRHMHTDYVTDSSYTDAQTGAHLRNLKQQTTLFDANGNVVAVSAISYDEPAYPLLTYASVSGWTNPGTTARGNPTTVKRWLNTNDTWLQSHTQFDQVGNPRKVWDPGDTALVNPTQITYSNTYRFSLPTTKTSADPDRTATTNGPLTPLATVLVYDFSTGLLTSSTDPNNVTATFEYNDPLDRPTRVVRAAGTSIQSQTTTAYNDAARTITTSSDLNVFNDNVITGQMIYDGFGRTIETRSYEGSTDYIARRTEYDALNRPFRVSNPYRQSETILWTTTTFDALGRVTSVTTPDNAVVTTFYSGNKVLSKDQIGKARLTLTDAMDRVTNVWEIIAADDQTENITFPNRPEITSGYRTKYIYDALSNLNSVTQQRGQFGPGQTRFFTYDSLSRLRATNFPESGFISYIYDDSDNLTTRIDARGVITSYVYDELNRPTSRSYNDGTASVTYSYDSATVPNGKGQLASVSSASSDYIYSSYDAYGRVLAGNQVIRAQINRTYSMSYTYDLAGNMKTMTYPSGHMVSNNYDGAGRLQNVSGTLGDGNLRSYSSGINYSSFGGMTQEQLGTATAVFNKRIYNSRGQLAEVRAGLTPFNTTWERGGIINHYSNNCAGSCGGSTSTATMIDNNGNLKKQEHWIPNASGAVAAVFTQKYDYDELNRLQRVYDGSSSNPTWQQRYLYDRFGNRTIEQANTSAGLNSTQFDRTEMYSTNRIYAPGDTALPMPQRRMQYDAAGNLTFDNYTGQGGRSYDAENRMTLAFGNGFSQFYSYDGEGNRVKRTVNGVETWQVYSVGGQLIAEYAAGSTLPQKEYGYREGQLLITTALSAGAPWGPPPTFTDNPLNPNFIGETRVKAIHISELRTAINSVRTHMNLAPVTWQSSANAGEFITANPISEMRTALDQAIGLINGGYSSGLTPGQPVKAIHVQELRDRVLSSWNTSNFVLDIRWIVTDQSGTPRIILDQSGSLANTSRHDYLPFGEELFAGAFGRTTALGYTNADGVRQKFTQKERDNETGLDYFGARYYANVQGRFTSPDPLMTSGTVGDPQSWNRYSYSLNNPLRYIDPNGLWTWDISAGGFATDEDLRLRSRNMTGGWLRSLAARSEAKRQLRFRERFRRALGEAQKAASSNRLTPDQRREVATAVAAYGTENSKPEVIVGMRAPVDYQSAQTELQRNDTVVVLFDSDLRRGELAEVTAHEGKHIADARAWVTGGECAGCSLDLNHQTREIRGWNVTSYTGQGLKRFSSGAGTPETEVWSRGWRKADISTKRAQGVNAILKAMSLSTPDTNTYSTEHHH